MVDSGTMEPTEILENFVMQRLPFSTLCKFRAVCKYWNTMPAVRPEDPFLLDIPCHSPEEDELRFCYLWSPVTTIWSHIDLSFIVATISQLGYVEPRITTYCSDGGLLCMWASVLKPYAGGYVVHYLLLVVNPLTRSCKALPRISDWCPGGRIMPMDLVMQKESSGGYKVFAATESKPSNTNSSALRYFMYESVSNSWKLIYAFEPQPPSPRCSIIFEGVFYSCLWDGLAAQYRLLTYDIAQGPCFIYDLMIEMSGTTLSFVVRESYLLLIVAKDLKFQHQEGQLERFHDNTSRSFSSFCFSSRAIQMNK